MHKNLIFTLTLPRTVNVAKQVYTILAISIYAKKKKVHLLTRNVQITAYKQLNTGMASLGLNHGIHPSGHGFVEGAEVLWRDLVPDLDRDSFQTSDLNKQTS